MSDDIPNRQGIILIISGPSGSGKSTIYRAALKELSSMEFSISCTTRAPREGEQDSKDYYFITKEEFKQKIADGAFAEWAEVHGNFYGTLKSELTRRTSKGIDVLLDIDVQGAAQVRAHGKVDTEFASACESIFVMPPSFAELEKRLRARGTETEESIERRLADAKSELTQWHSYDYILLNDQIENAVAGFVSIVRTMRMASKRFRKEPFDV